MSDNRKYTPEELRNYTTAYNKLNGLSRQENHLSNPTTTVTPNNDPSPTQGIGHFGGFEYTYSNKGVTGTKAFKEASRTIKAGLEKHPEVIGYDAPEKYTKDLDGLTVAVRKLIDAAIIDINFPSADFPSNTFDVPVNIIDIDSIPVSQLPENTPQVSSFVATEKGETRLGDVVFTIPPDQISILDSNNVASIPIARGLGSVKLRTGRTQFRVEMTIEIPTVDQFNTKVRPLIAQIKRSPWLPIENWHLKRLLMPVNPFHTADEFEDVELDTLADALNPPPDTEVEGALSEQVKGTADEILAEDVEYSKKIASVNRIKDTKVNLEEEILFVVVEDISIASNPGNPGYFYITLTCNVFNYTPFVNKIRYLVNDEDVATRINVDQKIKELANYSVDATSPEARAIFNQPYVINSTRDIRRSNVFKKYYQGFLDEYRREDTGADAGAPTKTYKGLPYLLPDYLVMPRMTDEQAQDLVLRGWIDKTTITGIMKEKAQELLRQAEIIRRGGNVANNRDINLSLLWDGIMDIVYMVSASVTEITSAFTTAGFKDASIRNGRIYIRDNKFRLVPIDEYIGTTEDDDRAKKSNELAIIMANYALSQGVLKMSKPLSRFDVLIGNNTKTVITGVNASMKTNTVPITMTGQHYPTFQHIGTGEFNVTMNIQTSDFELIRKLRFLNMALNRTRARWVRDLKENKDVVMSRRLFFRDFSIELHQLDNNKAGFLSALGIRKAVMPDVVYSSVPGQPGLWSITITLIQNDLDVIRQESVFATTGLTEDIVRDVTEILFDEHNHKDGAGLAYPWGDLAVKLQQWNREVEKIVTDEIEDNDGIFPAPPKVEFPSLKSAVGTILGRAGSALFPSIDSRLELLGKASTVPPLAISGPASLLRVAPALKGRLASVTASKLLANIAWRAEMYLYSSQIRGLLSVSQNVTALNNPAITARVRENLSDDLGLHNSCYPDLLLPAIPGVENEGTHPTHLKTPADFYLLGEQIIESKSFELAGFLHKTSGGIMDALATANNVDPWGRATAGVDRRAIRRQMDLREKFQLETLEILIEKRKTDLRQLNTTKVKSGFGNVSLYDNHKTTIEGDIEKLERYLNSVTVALGDKRVGDLHLLQAAEEEDIQYWEYGATGYGWKSLGDNIFNEVVNKLAETKKLNGDLSMAKAYPTFKIFFVEEDDERMLSFNDVYSYNAIQSIDVVWSRKSASKVAVIRMSNLTGTITDPLADMQTEASDSLLGVLTRGSDSRSGYGARYQDTAQEQIVNGLMIREGMRIIIRMGYSNDPTELHTVFDGGIVTMSPGDNIEIVAQSWAAELNTLIGWENDGIHIHYGTDELIFDKFASAVLKKRLFQVGYANIARVALREAGSMKRFGRRGPFRDAVDFQPKTGTEELGDVIIDKIRDMVDEPIFKGTPDVVKRFVDRFVSLTSNPADDNIWLTWDRTLPWYAGETKYIRNRRPKWWHYLNPWIAATELDKAIASNDPLSDWTSEFGFSWHIYRETAFATIQELLLFFPDHIYMELPYNESNMKTQRSTIYIGPRNGLYLAEDIDRVTNPILWEQHQEWIQNKAKALSIEDNLGVTGHDPIDPPTGSSPTLGEMKTKLDKENSIVDDRFMVSSIDDLSTVSRFGSDIARGLVESGELRFPSRLPVDGNPAVKPGGEYGAPRPKRNGVHEGIDYRVKHVPVKATIAGVAVVRVDSGGYGLYVTVDNGRISTVYGHLVSTTFSGSAETYTVMEGDIIGTSGGGADDPNRGESSGPHLHYEVRVLGTGNPRGTAVDPDGAMIIGAAQKAAGASYEKNTKGDFRAVAPDPGLLSASERKSVWEWLAAGQDDLNSLSTKGSTDYSFYINLLNGKIRDVRPKNPGDMWGRPGFKQVTRVHYLDNFHHIINNDIKASSQTMWNHVVLHYPDKDPVAYKKEGSKERTFEVWLDREMDSASERTQHTFLKNLYGDEWETLTARKDADDIAALPLAYRVASNILANGMREMYTGEITVLLDPTIRPWDRCHIFDYSKDMHGVIGVEEVHHHFDFETGAYTTIVPDLVVQQQNYPGIVADSWYQNIFGVGAVTIGATFLTSTAIGFAWQGLPGGAVGAAAGLISGYPIAKTIWGKFGGRLLGAEPSIMFAGLMYHERPYVAGMEGVRRETTWAVIKNALYDFTDFIHHFQNTTTVRPNEE